MIEKLKPKTIKIDLTKQEIAKSFSEVLDALAVVKLTAERILITLPSLELTFKEKSK